MPFIDLPLDELREYAPALPEPDDLDAFWAATLAETRAHDLAARFTPVTTGLSVIETFDLTFSGFGGDPIRGWLHRPVGAVGPLPAVVELSATAGGAASPTNRRSSPRRAMSTS